MIVFAALVERSDIEAVIANDGCTCLTQALYGNKKEAAKSKKNGADRAPYCL